MFTRKEGAFLVCQACRYLCRLADGDVGPCGVRKCSGDQVNFMGTIRVAEIEPVERRGFFHLMPASRVWTYWVGAGSSLAKNPPALPDDVVAVASGDPEVAWAFDLHADLAWKAREEGKGVLWRSRGLWTSPVLGLVPSLASAVFLVLDEGNRDRWGKILYEGAWLRNRGVWVEVALVPPPELRPRDLRTLLKTFTETLTPDTPFHVVRQFHPRTPASLLIQIAEALSGSLPFVYVDHLPGNPRENTFCPHCEAPLVYRFGWVVLENRVKDGRCPECHKALPGRWTR